MKDIVTWLVGAVTVSVAAASVGGNGAAMSIPYRMMHLAIQVGMILIFAKLGSRLFERIGQPGVLGELAAGMVIGPFALGRVPLTGFSHGIFPVYSTTFPIFPELYGLASVAAVVLLFVVGLETDLRTFLQYSLAGTVVGVGGVVVSFVLGDLTATLLAQPVLGERIGVLDPPALFLGVISTATSVGITARILAEMRQMDSPEGVTILSGAVIDDVMGIVLLAVVTALVTARGKVGGAVEWGPIGVIAVKAVSVWLVTTVLGLLASRKISLLLKLFSDRLSIAIMALGLALILAAFFEEAGLSMILGAYLMGLTLSRTDISHVVREGLHPIYQLVVPIFFCVMGMLIDFRALASPEVLIFGATYTAVAVGAKLLGCGLPAFLLNFNLRGAARIGTGMIPRGEVALIAAGIGMSLGILSDRIFAVAIIMTVVTTITAPPALLALFHGRSRGTRKDVSTHEEHTVSLPFTFPSPEVTQFVLSRLLGIFEAEGFFVHQLGREQPIYQMRKESMIIDFTGENQCITFDCDPSEGAMVHTAIYESVAQLEGTLRGLRQSVDAHVIGAGLQDQAASSEHAFEVGAYLSEAAIDPDLQVHSKAEAIDALVATAAHIGGVKDFRLALQAVWEREKSMSTGLQYGVAIPQGHTDAVDSLVCVVGLCHAGVDFGSLDGQPTRILILTLSPRSKPAPHIQFISAVNRVLNSEGRRVLLACRTAGEALDVLSGPVPAAPLRQAPPARAPAEAGVDLAAYIRPELILPALSGTTQEEILDEMLGLLDARGCLSNFQTARQAIHERERQMPTALQQGICLPHGRTTAVDTLVCAVGIKPEGVDCGALDGNPSTIFVMTLVPEDQPGLYMQFIASLLRALDENGRAKVLAAQTPEELRAALVAERTQ